MVYYARSAPPPTGNAGARDHGVRSAGSFPRSIRMDIRRFAAGTPSCRLVSSCRPLRLPEELPVRRGRRRVPPCVAVLGSRKADGSTHDTRCCRTSRVDGHGCENGLTGKSAMLSAVILAPMLHVREAHRVHENWNCGLTPSAHVPTVRQSRTATGSYHSTTWCRVTEPCAAQDGAGRSGEPKGPTHRFCRKGV